MCKKYWSNILRVLLAGAIAAGTLSNCASLPDGTGDLLTAAEADFFKQERFHLEEAPPLNDKPLQKYLQGIADKILKQVQLEPADVEVVDAVYAQAATELSTRTIYVTKGMIFALRNEAQLAGIVGHEIGHLKLGVGNVPPPPSALQNFATQALESATGIDGLSQQINDIREAQFLQKNEEAADRFGATTIAKLGYNPYALADVFDTLWGLSSHNALDAIRDIEQSHASLKDRATTLREYLKRNHLSQKGNTFAERYVAKVSHLQAKIDPDTLAARKNLKTLTAKLSHTRHLSAPEFIGYMHEARALAKTLNLLPQLAQRENPNHAHFLKELIPVTIPSWNGSPADFAEVENFLDTVAHVNLGFVPVVGESVALYEVLTGTDFITGDQLTYGQQVVTSLGLMVGAGTAWRGMASGLEEASQGAYGVARSVETTTAVKEAQQIADESELFGRSTVGKTYSAHFEEGPIPLENVQSSFLGAKYTEIEPQAGEKFYRVGNDVSSYWSRNEPLSQIQASSENAIHPDWNSFANKYEIEVPENYKGNFYEGLSGNMSGKILNEETGKIIADGSFFHGGGNQVYIPPSELEKLKPFITRKAFR